MGIHRKYYLPGGHKQSFRGWRPKVEQVFPTWPADDEPAHCAHFGCGLRLTMAETLAGTRCWKHSIIEKLNINTLIKRL